MQEEQKIIRVENPMLVESVIDQIQTRLSELTYQDNQGIFFPWLSIIYPSVEVDQYTKQPKYRISNEKYDLALPEKGVKSMCFFVVKKREAANELNRIFTIDLIVWFDTSKFGSDKHNVREYFINHLLSYMINSERPHMTAQDVYTQHDEVWKGINTEMFGLSSSPYDNFKITFTVPFYLKCNETFIAESKC